MQNTAVNPQLTYDWAYTYPAPGSAHPHSPTAIGEFNLTTDPNGNQITTQDTGTSDVSQYLFDEENRLPDGNLAMRTCGLSLARSKQSRARLTQASGSTRVAQS